MCTFKKELRGLNIGRQTEIVVQTIKALPEEDQCEATSEEDAVQRSPEPLYEEINGGGKNLREERVSERVNMPASEYMGGSKDIASSDDGLMSGIKNLLRNDFL